MKIVLEYFNYYICKLERLKWMFFCGPICKHTGIKFLGAPGKVLWYQGCVIFVWIFPFKNWYFSPVSFEVVTCVQLQSCTCMRQSGKIRHQIWMWVGSLLASHKIFQPRTHPFCMRVVHKKTSSFFTDKSKKKWPQWKVQRVV